MRGSQPTPSLAASLARYSPCRSGYLQCVEGLQYESFAWRPRSKRVGKAVRVIDMSEGEGCNAGVWVSGASSALLYFVSLPSSPLHAGQPCNDHLQAASIAADTSGNHQSLYRPDRITTWLRSKLVCACFVENGALPKRPP
jgi:hypothetical protein